MTPEQFNSLKQNCGEFLKANEANPETKAGAKLIHAFWYGALCALNEPNNAVASVLLLSGRQSELVS